MREILFRAKKISNNEWIRGYLINNIYGASKPVIITDSDYDDGNKVNFDYDFVYTETLGQFTGLYDENGKRIFEGDIVKCTTHYGERRSNRAVVFVDGQFLLENKGDYILAVSYEKEVIGNIYDNPELLEE